MPMNRMKGGLILGQQTALNTYTQLIPINGLASDASSGTYKARTTLGRAAKVTNIYATAGTVPIGGTNALKVKNISTGNTMLNAASMDPTTLSATVATALGLTAVAADLAIPALGYIDVELDTGSETTPAVDMAVVIEYTLNDYEGPTTNSPASF